MNMFVLHADPLKSVEGMYKTHVTKMPLEATQLLSTAVGILGGHAPYKPYNPHSDLMKWIVAHVDNYSWLWHHAFALFNEFHERRGKHHGSLPAFDKLPVPTNVSTTPYSLPPLYMEPNYRRDCKSMNDVVNCYRTMYKYQKKHLADFETAPPSWYNKI